MRCQKCNAVNTNSAKFCYSCGTELHDTDNQGILSLCKKVNRRKKVIVTLLYIYCTISFLATVVLVFKGAQILKEFVHGELPFLICTVGCAIAILKVIVYIIVISFMKSATDLFVKKCMPK